MTDLFDLDVPEVVHSGADTTVEQCHEAWRVWAETTRRPDLRNPDRDFLKAYRHWLQKHYSHAEMLETVRGAARVRPHGNDARDIKRVLNALEFPRDEAYALQQLREEQPVIPFPRRDAPKLQAELRDLEAALGTQRGDWTARDREAAMMLIEDLDAKGIAAAADDVALMLGVDTLLPLDLLRNLRSGRRGDVARNATRSTYKAGRSEDEALKAVVFEADVDAERLRLNGGSVEDIIALHDAAPDGYWDAVLDAMEEDPSAAYEAIYDELEPSWSWHPKERR